MARKNKFFDLNDHQRRIIDALRHGNEVSRNALGDQLGISPQTMMRAVNPLVEMKLVSELEEISADRSRGKPPRLMSLRDNSLFVLGVSIAEGRNIIEIRDFRGTRVDRVVEIRDFSSAREQVDRLKSLLATIIQGFNSPERIVTLGAVVQGFFVERGRRIVQRIDPAGWAAIDLKAELEEAANVPALLVNDGRALASSLISMGQSQNFIAVVLARGVGGGVVIEGKLANGTMGNAGEIGGLVGGGEYRPTEANALKALGISNWDNWGGLENLPPETFTPFNEWCKQAAHHLSTALNACNAILDFEIAYIGSRMPLDVLQLLTAKLELLPPVSQFPNVARRYQPAVPLTQPMRVESFSALASQIGIHAFLAPSQINLHENVERPATQKRPFTNRT